jgi:OmpA-OmpF porin, OOP family
MRPVLWQALIAAPLFLLTPGALHAQRTVANAGDHPLLRRAVGSEIAQREVKTNHTCDLPTGAVEGNRFSQTREFRGTVTTITYTQKQGASIGDVYRQLEQQLLDSGIRVFFKCKDGKCGEGTGPANFCTPAWRGSNGQRQLTGEIQNGGRIAVLSLHVQAPENRQRAVAHLTVVEAEGSTWPALGAGIRPGTKPAATFSTATLLSTGKVMLPEPLFQSKSASLRAETTPVLADIARFLTQNPGVNVTVANSTSTDSGWLRDIGLSRDRALAITTALTTRYGIAANRLKAQGNGGQNMDTVEGDSQTQLIVDK